MNTRHSVVVIETVCSTGATCDRSHAWQPSRAPDHSAVSLASLRQCAVRSIFHALSVRMLAYSRREVAQWACLLILRLKSKMPRQLNGGAFLSLYRT